MTDFYDEEHSETGSSNISRATPEWREKLQTARALYNGTKPVLHIAYELVNEEAKRGTQWSKCTNCGSPFKGHGETCSDKCYDDYVAYISS